MARFFGGLVSVIFFFICQVRYTEVMEKESSTSRNIFILLGIVEIVFLTLLYFLFSGYIDSHK